MTKRHIQGFSAFLFRQGDARSTRARKLSALRSLFRHLLHTHTITADPCRGVRNPRQEQRHPAMLNVDQAFELLADTPPSSPATADDAIRVRDRALMELLYGSGLRISEALNLDVDDYAPGDRALMVMGKGDKQRLSPLSDTSRSALNAWLTAGPCWPERTNERCSWDGAERVSIGGRRPALWRRRPSWPAFNSICPPMTCVTPTPLIFWKTARICAAYRNCWGIAAFPPRNATPTSTLMH